MSLIAALLPWALANWRGILMSSISGIIAGWIGYQSGHLAGYRAGNANGRTELTREIADQVKERRDAAGVAEDVVRRCIADDDCRLRDEPFRRD